MFILGWTIHFALLQSLSLSLCVCLCVCACNLRWIRSIWLKYILNNYTTYLTYIHEVFIFVCADKYLLSAREEDVYYEYKSAVFVHLKWPVGDSIANYSTLLKHMYRGIEFLSHNIVTACVYINERPYQVKWIHLKGRWISKEINRTPYQL